METDKTNISKNNLRDLILNVFKEPKVFTNVIDWKLLAWSLDDWAKKLGDEKLPFRTGKKKIEDTPQWERGCEVMHLTMSEFIKEQESDTNKFLYFDYKHMREWFHGHPDILQDVSWANLGFDELKGADSTVWIGSDGAHTPCHVDTYGCNLVAQVYGRKSWVMFPPNTSSPKSVRVPYEESSIYCSSPHPIYEKLDEARMVTLNPGEVLFVPRHWWHYVENVGTAISINTWIPLPFEDDLSRLDESLVKLFVNRMCVGMTDSEKHNLLNPNEDDLADTPLQDILRQISFCLDKCETTQNSQENRKRRRRSESSEESNSRYTRDFDGLVRSVNKCTADELRRVSSRIRQETPLPSLSKKTDLVGSLVNAFCHPDIIKSVREKLMEQMQN